MALVLASACGGEEPAQPVAAQPESRAAAPSTKPAPASAAPLRVEVTNGRVSVEAHDALALAVLERLASRAGFRVSAGAEAPRTVSLRLDQATLEAAIAAILAGTPYGLDYRYDSARGVHAVDVVRVGARAADAIARRTPAEAERPTSAATPPRPLEAEGHDGVSDDPIAAVDLGRVLADRAAADPDSALDPETLAALSDRRDTVRAEAVAELGTEGPDLETVIAFAKADPSPLVRGAAIDALGDDGRFGALAAVLAALDDPDPNVVLRAIAVIEDAGDATLVVRIGLLARHGSSAVRARAAEALEQLE